MVKVAFFHTTISHFSNSIKEINNLYKFKSAVKKYLSEQASPAEQNPSHHNRYLLQFIFDVTVTF